MTITAPTTFMGHNTGGGGGGDATVFSSRHDYAVFDGVNDYVDVGTTSDYDLTDTFTISLWFNSASVTTNGRILSRRSGTTGYDLYFSFSKVYLYTGTFGGTSSVLNTDQWYHLTVVINGASSQMYINGVADGSTWNPSISSAGTTSLYLGRFTSNYVDGFLRDVRIYDDVLTTDEITYLYTEGASGTDPTNTNLVGHWKFDDGEGGLIADSSSSGNDGQAHNITEPLFWDKYATFDGVDDYVAVPDSAELNPSVISISAWVYDNDISKIHQFVRKRLNANDGYKLEGRSNTWKFIVKNGGVEYTASTAATANGWFHLVGTYDGSTAAIYVNGTLQNSVSATGSPISSDALYIGARGADEFLDGSLRDVRIYSDALTSDEVTYLYTAGESGTDPTETNLVGKWLLNDGEGSVVVDSSSSGNDGTATNITEPLFWNQPHADFDGSNDYVDVGDLGITSSEVSVSMWLNTDVNAASAVYKVFNNYDFSGPAQYIMIGINTSGNASQKFQFSVDNGTSHVTAFSNSTVTTGTWYHIVGIYNSSTNEVSIWVDGTKQTATGTIIGSDPAFNQYHYTIGKNEASAQYYWDGKVRDVRIYNDALTSDEVLYLATAGESGTNPGTANLVGHWKLNDRYGTIAEDSAGANDGTATNITESTFWVQ